MYYWILAYFLNKIRKTTEKLLVLTPSFRPAGRSTGMFWVCFLYFQALNRPSIPGLAAGTCPLSASRDCAKEL